MRGIVARRVGMAAAVACLAGVLTGSSAAAQEDYPPDIPTVAAGVCVGDIPYFQFQVDFGSSEFVGRAMRITFVNPDGEDFVIETTVPRPGARQQVLWPGAAEDPNPDWPGWELNDSGIWVEVTDDAGAFTRAPEGVRVIFEVNPTLSTTTTYPPASAICSGPQSPPTEDPPNDPGTTPPGTTETPDTGADVGVLALGGLALAAAGGALVVVSRRRRSPVS